MADSPVIFVNCASLSTTNTNFDVKPLYRLFNPVTHDHLYTTSDLERTTRLTEKNSPWRNEGVAALIPKNGSEATGAPMYRVGHPDGIAHMYTLQSSEANGLREKGWIIEDIYYGANKWPAALQVPMRGRRSDGLTPQTDVVWTTNDAEYNSLSNWIECNGTWITAQNYLVMDARGNSNDNGTTIQVYPGNNTDAQIWTLQPPSGATNGGWIIKRRIGGKIISREAYHNDTYYDIALQDPRFTASMYWDITPVNGRKFYFGGVAYQPYYIHRKISNKEYYLEVLTGNDGVPHSGSPLTACKWSGSTPPSWTDHMWLIIPTSPGVIFDPIMYGRGTSGIHIGGVYSIHPYHNNPNRSQLLDIEGPGKSNVKIWYPSGSNGQLWIPIKLPEQTYGKDVYAIKNLGNGGYLDVPGTNQSEVVNGANVQVYPTFDGKTETWHMVGFGRTTVNGKDAALFRIGIMGAGNKEYVLDAHNESYADDTNIQVYEMKGISSQLFAFVPHDENDPSTPTPSKLGLSRTTSFANQTFQRLADESDEFIHAFPCWTCTDSWFGDVGVANNSINENGYEVNYRRRYYNNKTNQWDAWSDWSNWESCWSKKVSGNNVVGYSSQYVRWYKKETYRNEQVQWQVRCIGTSSDYTESVHGAYAEAMLYYIAVPYFTFGTEATGEIITCQSGVTEYPLHHLLRQLLSFEMYVLNDETIDWAYNMLPSTKIENNAIILDNQKDSFIGDGVTSEFTIAQGAGSIINVEYDATVDTFDVSEGVSTLDGIKYILNYTADEIESVTFNESDSINSLAYSVSGTELTIHVWPTTDEYIILNGVKEHPQDEKPNQYSSYFIPDPDGKYLFNEYKEGDPYYMPRERFSLVENPVESEMSTYYEFYNALETDSEGQPIVMKYYQPLWLTLPDASSLSTDVLCQVYLNDRLLINGVDYEIVFEDSCVLKINQVATNQTLRVTYYTDEPVIENSTLSVSYLTDYDVIPTIKQSDNKKLIFNPPIPNGMAASVEYSFAPELGTVMDIRYLTNEQPMAAISLDGLVVPYLIDLDGRSNIYIMEMSIVKDNVTHKVLTKEQAITGLDKKGRFIIKFDDFINYIDGDSLTFKYQVGNDQHVRWTDRVETATLGLNTSAGTLDIWGASGPSMEQGPRHTGIIYIPNDTNIRCGMIYKDKVFELPRWGSFDKTVDGVRYAAFILPYSFRDRYTRVIGQRSNSNGEFGIESAKIDLHIFDQEKVHSWITTDSHIVCIDCREGDYLQSDRSMQKNNTALDLSGREHQTVIFGDTNQSSFTVEGSIIYSEDYRNTDSTLEDIDSLLGTHTIYRDPYGHVVYAAVTDVSYQTHHDYATVSISMIEETR